MTYETLWRNKWLTSEATSIDDMIESLQSAVDELKDMRAEGVVLDADRGGVSDDYATLVTTDPDVAAKFGMQEEEKWEEEEDDPDDEEPE